MRGLGTNRRKCSRNSAAGRADGEENATWGYTRIQGALKNFLASGRPLDDCPDLEGAGSYRRRRTPDFVANVSASALGGHRRADFFTTEVWTWRGLVTYYTVFVIDLTSRRVQILSFPGEALESAHALRSASSVLAALAKRMPSIALRKRAAELLDVALAEMRWVTPRHFPHREHPPPAHQADATFPVPPARCRVWSVSPHRLCRMDAPSSHVATAYSPVCSRQSCSPSGRP